MNPKELSNQLKKPTGSAGIEVAKALNDSNRKLYKLSFELLELKPGQQILEIGFGNGIHFPEYFEIEPLITVTGVDFSKDMCEEARGNNADLIATNRLKLHCDDTSALPFSDNRFDHIVALNLIYFLDPPEVHLQEIHRVLKPGGIFLIGYRPRHSVQHLEFTKQNFVLYEADELTSLFEKNGFQKVNETTNSYKKVAMDNTAVNVTDACLVVMKV